MHEGWYTTEKGANKAARKHKGKVTLHKTGFWKGTYEVKAPVSRAKRAAIRLSQIGKR